MRKSQILNIFILVLTTILIVISSLAFIMPVKKVDTIFDNSPVNNKDDSSTPIKDNPSKLGEIDNISFYIKQYENRYLNYQEKNPTLSIETIIKHVNIGIDNDFYTNVNQIKDPNNYLVLVNKYNKLDSDYVPSDLVNINSRYSSGTQKLRKNAALAFEDMAKVAKADGLSIRAISTYRSFSYQENLYANYVNKNGDEQANRFSAKAGYSEHQTGLAVDIDNRSLSYTNFGKTKAFTWMKENAHRFGFILRYPESKTNITGFMYEPWHYRYVGIEIATFIYNNDLTFDEYIATNKK